MGIQTLDEDRCFGALFDAIDISGDGTLAYGEIRDYQWYKNPRVFQLLGISNFTDMVGNMDADGNGKVDRQEFIDYMKKLGLNLSWKTAVKTSTEWGTSCSFENRGTKRKADDVACDGTDDLVAAAKKSEFTLSAEALAELKKVSSEDAKGLLKDLGQGGKYYDVQEEDKNFFIIQELRRKAARTS